MFDLNPALTLTVQSIGQEPNLLVIVDQVVADPDALVAAAKAAGFQQPAPGSRYPGLNARLPDAYKAVIRRDLLPRLLPHFGAPAGLAVSEFGFFGQATKASDDMAVRQAAPHIDSFNPNSFASVHYLFHADLGGTGFYRHRASGRELILPSRSHGFERAKRLELDRFTGTGAEARAQFFEKIAEVEPKFNRLIFYRAGQLHYGEVKPGPETRLTANMFFNV